MVRSYSFAWMLVSLLSLTLAAPLQADITPSGDVDPTSTSWWIGGGESATLAFIGKTATGSVTVNLGSDLSSLYGFIGCEAGATGVVAVDGNGSTWTNGYGFYVGYYGQGTLHITNGGAVGNDYDGIIGFLSGSTGVVTVDGSGSTWACGSIYYCGPYVGYYGQGTLNITNGGAVSNTRGYIGHESGSTGVVTVDGSGSTWTNSSNLHVGNYGHGTLNITNGGAAISNYGGYIGSNTGSTGEVTVNGSDSTWTNSGYLHVGDHGHGTLNITNGGAVNVTRDIYVARNDGAAGEIHFDDGTLTTRSLFAGPTHLTGTGTINTHGLVSDVDLLFDSTHGLNQTLTFNSQPGQNITINLTQDSTGYLGAGYAGGGTLAIRDGVSVKSYYGYIGYKAGSTGVVTVDGSGSTWNNRYYSYVGNYGQGTLNITNGGAVSTPRSYVGYYSGSTGVVTVDGNGSTWTNSSLYVGISGHGTLDITNGGTVINGTGYIGHESGSAGVVTVDGSGSTWTNSSNLHVGGGSTDPGGTGELTVSGGGSVAVGETLKVWGPGTLNIGATGQVTVGEALVLVQDSTLTAETGATIHMTGSAFRNESTNSANLAGLGNLTLIFEGGSVDIDPFEVAGAIDEGFNNNFALGSLVLGGIDVGKVQLVDSFDNGNRADIGSECLFTHTLTIHDGSLLDLNGLWLYVEGDVESTLDYWIGDGRLFDSTGLALDASYDPAHNWTEVPEPATMLLLALGACLPLLRKRR